MRLNSVDAGPGTPQHTTLAIAQRSTDSVSDTELKPVRFTFPTPPTLLAGKRYALVLMLFDPTDDGWQVERRISNPCPGGTLFIMNPPGPFSALSSGLPFRTYVSP